MIKTMLLASAVAMLALFAPATFSTVQGFSSSAYAQTPCNVAFSGKACVACAKSRGYTPVDYCSYCGNPPVKECRQKQSRK